MMVEMSEEQARELLEVVETRSNELLRQIEKAFDREFKDTLRSRYEHIDALRLQLQRQLASLEAYA